VKLFSRYAVIWILLTTLKKPKLIARSNI